MYSNLTLLCPITDRKSWMQRSRAGRPRVTGTASGPRQKAAHLRLHQAAGPAQRHAAGGRRLCRAGPVLRLSSHSDGASRGRAVTPPAAAEGECSAAAHCSGCGQVGGRSSSVTSTPRVSPPCADRVLSLLERYFCDDEVAAQSWQRHFLRHNGFRDHVAAAAWSAQSARSVQFGSSCGLRRLLRCCVGVTRRLPQIVVC